MMRTLLLLLVLTTALLATVWVGGETLLARSAVHLIADDPRLAAATVTELREGRRVGLGLTGVSLTLPEVTVTLPQLALWVPPHRPNEVHVTLPRQASVGTVGRTVAVGADAAELSARFSPTRGLALSQGVLDVTAVTLDAAPVAQRIEATARLVGFGHDAPQGTGAAYDVQAAVAGLSLPALTAGRIAGVAGAEGKIRVWLTHPPSPRMEGAAPLEVIGLRADGLRLNWDDLAATVWGRVAAGDEGEAEGMLAVDTADADVFLSRAAEFGLLPPAVAPFAGALLKGVAGAPPPPVAVASEADPSTSSDSPEAEPSPPAREGAAEAVARRALEKAQTLPPVPEGQLRLILTFRDGQTWLGPIPVGPAPRFR